MVKVELNIDIHYLYGTPYIHYITRESFSVH